MPPPSEFRSWTLTAALLVCAVACLAGAGGQSAEPVRVEIGAVLRLTSGVPVLEIACSNFEVRVDDQPRPIRDCRHGDPVTVALLFDVSGSVEYVKTIESLVSEVTDALRPVDRAGVGWFAKEIVPPKTFAANKRALDAAVDAATRASKQAAGPSPLWDALTATVSALSHEPGRRAIIVITDGHATGNLAPFPAAAGTTMMSGVELHSIGVALRPPAGNVNSLNSIEDRLARLALSTGGTADSWRPSYSQRTSDLRQILEDLQRSYLLAFDAVPDGQTHRLEVRVKTPGIVIRAPSRYAR